MIPQFLEMISSSDPPYRIHPEPTEIDHFDRLPDSVLMLVLNKISDVKSLGRCCVVSKRFQCLVTQVDNVVVKVDCVISDEELSSGGNSVDKSRTSFSGLVRILFGGLCKPFLALGQLLGPRRGGVGGSGGGGVLMTVGSSDDGEGNQGGGVMRHYSPTQVLRSFEELRFLRIELPSGELGIDDGVLLKWRADFGSTLDRCAILGAASVVYPGPGKSLAVQGDEMVGGVGGGGEDNGSIPESFYTNGGLKLRVVWTISSLIAASARHYLLQPIIAEHKTLDSLVLTDADGQGVLCMNRDQLEELRVKPLAASSASKRTMVPALNMRLWYAPQLELPDGVVLKGATLVAIRPSDQTVSRKDVSDCSWVLDAFEGSYGTAARMLVKRRTYCLEMNSF